jgi:hypothetical protein
VSDAQATLGALTLTQSAFSGFAYPSRALIVPLLAPDPADGGNAVLQSGALTLRQATITWTALTTSDKDTALGYFEQLTSVAYVDYFANSSDVWVTDFSATYLGEGYWTCQATLTEQA